MSYEFENVSIRLVKEAPVITDKPVDSPGRAVEILYDYLHDMDREMLIVVNLKADMTPINMNIVSIGTVVLSIGAPREVLKSAILSNAACSMFFHNHPSGNLTPSQADINLTDKLIKAFYMMDIPVMDHIILGPNRQYYSMRENKVFRIPEPSEPVKVEDLNFNMKVRPKNKSQLKEKMHKEDPLASGQASTSL